MAVDISSAEPIFGHPVRLYGPIVSTVLPRVVGIEYRFLRHDLWVAAIKQKNIGPAEANNVIATELLYAAHLAAVTSVIRAGRWIEATAREYSAASLLGWAATCRSLLESTGDAIHGLGSVALSLAENADTLQQGLDGLDPALINAQPIEDMLVHFNNARNIPKPQQSSFPPEHVKLHTTAYINYLEDAGLHGAKSLYSELCEIGHPARASLDYLYEYQDFGSFRVDPNRDLVAIKEIIVRHRDVLEAVPSVAFNPGLLILRVLQKFEMFPRLPEMRKFEFQGAAAWPKIQKLL